MLQSMNLCASSSSSFKSSCEAGFSLLELAIVLVILGLIGGLSLPLLTTQINRTATLKTRSHQDYALNAIAAYVEKNKKFPCPAEPHISGAGYGVAQIQCRGQKAKGILPFKTLGISEIYARDGFKRLMTYGIEPEFTKKDTALQNEKGGFITVQKEGGESVIAPPLMGDKNPNCIAFVLISHGESGIGSYHGNGQTTRNLSESPSPHKRENFDENFVFIESNQTDDILRWESRDQFLKHYVKFK